MGTEADKFPIDRVDRCKDIIRVTLVFLCFA